MKSCSSKNRKERDYPILWQFCCLFHSKHPRQISTEKKNIILEGQYRKNIIYWQSLAIKCSWQQFPDFSFPGKTVSRFWANKGLIFRKNWSPSPPYIIELQFFVLNIFISVSTSKLPFIKRSFVNLYKASLQGISSHFEGYGHFSLSLVSTCNMQTLQLACHTGDWVRRLHVIIALRFSSNQTASP